jgi:hypothetical protein
MVVGVGVAAGGSGAVGPAHAGSDINANRTVRRSICGGARYYELCGATIRRVEPGATLTADDLELRTQDRQPNDGAKWQIGLRWPPPCKALLRLDLLLVAAHAASRFVVHRMLP